jgi:hypothetical protein
VFGVDSRGDELPAELADRRSRRVRLERCEAELESEHAEREQTFREHICDRERWGQKAGKKMTGRKPQPPEQHELTQSRLNVTDPGQSRDERQDDAHAGLQRPGHREPRAGYPRGRP